MYQNHGQPEGIDEDERNRKHKRKVLKTRKWQEIR